MLTTSLLLALGATTLAQTIPAGYSKVYITSAVDAKFVVVPKMAANGSTVVVQTLNNKPEQQWYIQSGNTTIQLADTTLCLDAGAKKSPANLFAQKANWKDMANIYLQTCSATEAGQQWVAMTDGRIALAASSPQECVDLQYMRATANNPVGLYKCAGLGNAGAADKGINWPLVNVTA
ncbi:ricin B lectin domain-containing protein [Pestalotiopsis sp. NC0098]|nr:ricin B lectin domain-containing protein [Pestalotiopsis sp. NC0098]